MAASLQALRERAALMRVVRDFFDDQDFLEVDTPAIAVSPGLELHLDAVGVRLREGMGGALVDRWLITSPEYHCKRLLARGMERIYRLGKSFRSGERGDWHNPEFTMLEWYRAGCDYRQIAEDTLALIDACNAGRVALQPAQWLGFDDLVSDTIGFDPMLIEDDEMLSAATAAGFAPIPGERADELLMRAWVERIEPTLPADRALVIHRYPARLASLARLAPADSAVAERAEVYLRGVELANGFSELVDANVQRKRFEKDLGERTRRGLPTYPIDERFLDALTRCPPAAGIALGVERLHMVLGGYRKIDEVIAFPFEVA